jgi:hypothetical protein
METFPLQRKWQPVIVVGGVILIIGIGCMIAITWPVVPGQSGSRAGGPSLWRVLLFDLVLLAFVFWGVWHLTSLTLTRVDMEGITAPRLFRAPVKIGWKDIVRISGGPRSCLVSSNNARIRLSSLHVGGELLAPTLQRFAPPSAFD